MNAKYLIIYNDAKGEKVEHIGKMVPDIGISVLSRTFGVEPVGLGNPAGLVVAAD